MQTKAMSEAAMLIAIFLVMALATIYLPLGFVMTTMLATPHALIARRHGWRQGVVALVASGFLAMFFLDIFSVYFVVAFFGSIGVAIGFGARRWKAIQTLLLSTAVAILVIVIPLVLILLLSDQAVVEGLLHSYNELVVEVGEMYQRVGVSAATWEEMAAMMQQLMLTLVPFLLIAVSFSAAYVNYFFFTVIGRRLQINVPPIPALLQWNFPRWTGVAFIVGYVLSQTFETTGVIRTIGYNLLFIFYWVILGQGLSFISVLLFKSKIPRILFLLMVLLIIFNPLLTRVVVLVGLFDMFFNYRGWISERSGK